MNKVLLTALLKPVKRATLTIQFSKVISNFFFFNFWVFLFIYNINDTYFNMKYIIIIF